VVDHRIFAFASSGENPLKRPSRALGVDFEWSGRPGAEGAEADLALPEKIAPEQRWIDRITAAWGKRLNSIPFGLQKTRFALVTPQGGKSYLRCLAVSPATASIGTKLGPIKVSEGGALRASESSGMK
jgi:hypothetical protein